MDKFKRILILVLTVFLLLSCAGCKQKTQLDYTFYGSWFVDGQLGDETYTFAVEGKIPTNIQPDGPEWVEETIEFGVIMPEEFPYYFVDDDESDCIIYRSSSVSCPAHYYVIVRGYNRSSSGADRTAFPEIVEIHICPQEEYIVVGFVGKSGKYLIGAADANVSLEEVAEHFSFIHTSPSEE